MLKKLSNRLQAIFMIAIMCLITAVMAVLSYGQYQSEVAADKNYLQKMASLPAENGLFFRLGIGNRTGAGRAHTLELGEQ